MRELLYSTRTFHGVELPDWGADLAVACLDRIWDAVIGAERYPAPVLQGKHSAPSDLAGLRIDRYEVVEVMGSGGGGTVYRAYDGQLGRHVSLKLLHASSTQAEARGRLLREAKVLARLSHPNVVAAYDVGVHEGALFITMEFIEGVSLRDWLAQPRQRAEVLRVLIAAGRGLVAAHESGVLHCDFKPANVMVAADGRVRVIDFGLARAAALAASEVDMPPSVSPSPASSPSPAPFPDRAGMASSHTLTRTGGVIGSPGFVPPEQWLDGTIDHRGDQFSFAVSAFIALTGAKPYPEVRAASELRDLGRARPPWPRSVPHGLRRIVERGMSLRPEHRYPSLEAMVDALDRFARPWKRRGVTLAWGGALAATVLLSGALPGDADSTTPCNMDAAVFNGVWGPIQRARLEKAFFATASPNAADAFALVSQRLDSYQSEWLAMRRDSCEATFVREQQPEQVMALRASCLDRALEGTKALVGALAEVDAATFNRAAEASPASLAGCADAALLVGSADHLPSDPAMRASIDDVEVGIAVDQALITAGRRPESVEQAQRVLALARTTEHVPTLARATAQLGRATLGAASTTEQRSSGEAILAESQRLAAMAGDDQLLAQTASYVFYSTAYVQTRVREGEAMLPAADALVWRAGNPPLQRIELCIGRSALLVRHNRFDEASAVLEEAIRLAEQNVGYAFERFANSAATELGFVYSYAGRFAEAEAMGQRGVDGMRRRIGAHHPRLLNSLGNLATLQAKAGHLEQALETVAQHRALAATMPPTEPTLKYVPLSESRVWRLMHHCDRAIPLQREALTKFSAADGPDHPLTFTVMYELGQCLTEANQIPEAISLLERVLEKSQSSQDAATPDAAFALARALWRVPAQRQRARSLAETAQSLWRADGSTRQASEVAEWLTAHAA